MSCRRARSLTVPVVLSIAVGLVPVPRAQIVFEPPHEVLPAVQYPFGGSVVTGDFDGDGHLDLVVTQEPFAAPLVLLLGQGDGVFAPAPVPLQGTGPALAARDVDDDGHLDVVAAAGVNLMLHRGHGDGTFAPAILLPSTSAQRVACADLDGNGRTDVVVQRSIFTAEPIQVLLQTEDGSFVVSQSITTGPSFPAGFSSVTLADIDSDGVLDLVLGANHGLAYLHAGTGDGLFSPAGRSISLISPVALTTHVLTTDLDGDGEVDLLAVRATEVVLYLGTGDGSFGSQRLLPALPATGGFPVAADWDGDGLRDLAIGTSTGGGALGELVVLRNLDGGSFAPALALTGGGPFVQSAVGDFDEDGLPDLAAFRTTYTAPTGTTVILLNATYGRGEPFTDLGGATAGGAGWPVLLCTGSLRGGTPWSATLAAAPQGALPVLVVGHSALQQPTLGGLLWPAPDRLLLMPPVGADGRSTHAGTWPPGWAGLDVWLQVWFADTGAPQGWASTTGVAASAPR